MEDGHGLVSLRAPPAVTEGGHSLLSPCLQHTRKELEIRLALQCPWL